MVCYGTISQSAWRGINQLRWFISSERKHWTLPCKRKRDRFGHACAGLVDTVEEIAHAGGIEGGRRAGGEGGEWLANKNMFFPSFLTEWHMWPHEANNLEASDVKVPPKNAPLAKTTG